MQRFRLTSFFAGQATRFARDEKGATAIEYAIIAGGIASAIVAVVMSLGTSVTDNYDKVSTALLELYNSNAAK
jgi:pilus assembly protein Flp/PilA